MAKCPINGQKVARESNPIDGPLDEVGRLAVFLVLVVAFAMWGCVLIGRHTAPRREYLEPANIDLLKDAASIIGPGEPISRDLWRLAERMEGDHDDKPE